MAAVDKTAGGSVDERTTTHSLVSSLPDQSCSLQAIFGAFSNGWRVGQASTGICWVRQLRAGGTGGTILCAGI